MSISYVLLDNFFFFKKKKIVKTMWSVMADVLIVNIKDSLIQ
jgi:hypothetical protein